MYWLLQQKGNPSVQYFDTVFSYSIFVGSCFVAFVVHMVVFFLQVELDPVVKTHDLLAVLGFSNKHMFKSTGILTIMYSYNIFQRFIKRPCVPSFIHPEIESFYYSIASYLPYLHFRLDNGWTHTKVNTTCDSPLRNSWLLHSSKL